MTTATTISEISENIFRISTPVPPSVIPSGFSFNQYLIVDDMPLLFHTGPRKLFPAVAEAIGKLIPLDLLRYIGFSHVEADECGSLNDLLALAPNAQPVCGKIAAMTSVDDIADKAPLVLQDNEQLVLGKHILRWLDTPHLPHGWESGLFLDESTETLFCGDLFTQPGTGSDAITTEDILTPSEKLRHALDYFSASSRSVSLLRMLAAKRPSTLACMHGSAWKGDGAALLSELANRLESELLSLNV